jgi:hypothetical protein
MPADMDLALRRCSNAVTMTAGGSLIEAGSEPAGEMRVAMEGRLDALRRALGPGDRVKIAETVAALLMLFPSRGGEMEAAKVVAGYVEALRALPLWAVAEACDGFRRGVGGASPFRPSSAQLCDAANKACDALRKEWAGLQKVLSAKVHKAVPVEERRATLERLRPEIEALRAHRESLAEDGTFKAWVAEQEGIRRKRDFEAAGLAWSDKSLGPESRISLNIPLPSEKSQEPEIQAE